ncbi:hypothetical protein TNCV_2365911 [Trichonephila clavipes]|nr:hypothetical protein TNCV_2365911 [Trichonephila clavipes]
MDKLNNSKRAIKGTITKIETFAEESGNHTPTKLDIKLKRVQEMNRKIDELKDQYYDIKDISESELQVIEADIQSMEDRLEELEGRVVVYRASTPQVWGCINGLGKVDSAFHPRYIGSINEYQALLGVLNTEGLSSDSPPNRDICSCTSVPNGHVNWDGNSSSWPSWIVVPLSLSFQFEDCLTLGIPLR